MLNYFGFVFRKTQKNKVNAINKVAGLTIAVVACLLIAFYVNDEFSYDRFHSKKDRIYRLIKNDETPNPIWPKVMFQYLKDSIPGVEKIADFSNQFEGVFTVNQTPFVEEGAYAADPEILDMLDFHISESQIRKEDLLVTPNTMLISRKMAEKFFKNENPVGKAIRYNLQFDMTITGVFENFPDRSHVNPQFLISSSTVLSEYMDHAWHAQGHNAYVLLSPKASPEEAAQRIKELVCHAAPEAKDMFAKTNFSLQPITDIHLFSSGFTFLFSRIPVMRIFQNSYKIGGENLRKTLIVFQFTIAVMLIAGTVFMYRQMQLLTKTKLGFDKEQLLVINNNLGNSDKQYELFKSLVDKLPTVESVSSVNNVPVGSINNGGSIKKAGATDDGLHSCTLVYPSVGFLPAIHAHFLAGTDFTESNTGNQVILSRKLVEALDETPETIIGKEYVIDNYRDRARKVVGVVDDIQYFPYRMKDKHSGTVFQNLPWLSTAFIVVRTTKGDWRNIVSNLEKIWKEMAPGFPFHYEMIDKRLEESYKEELTNIRTFTAFSVVAIVLSCFGVMGISYYTTRKRTKEIAIRKVHGANKKEILLMLNYNFLFLNLIAFLIAIPAVILFINHWLQNFSYKIGISWWVFVLVGLFTSVIVLATVSWQSLKAASANPVDALKTE